MAMLRQALALWKQERHKGTPLQRRLFAFFACMAAFLILVFVTLILLFNINGSGTPAILSEVSSPTSIPPFPPISDGWRSKASRFRKPCPPASMPSFRKKASERQSFRRIPTGLSRCFENRCGRSRA